MNSKKINYWVVLCIVCLPFVFNWLGIHAFFSSPLSIGITSVLLTICLLCNFDKIIKITDFMAFLLIVLTLLINAVLYNDLGCVFTCYNIFVMSLLFNNITFEKKQMTRVHLLIVILMGIFFLTLNFNRVYNLRIFQANGEEINANAFGVLVLAFYYHFLLLINAVFKGKIKYLPVLCITLISIYYIHISECRSAYLAILTFLILCLFKRWKMRNYKKILFTLVVIAIVFPFVYLFFAEALKGITFAGKSLLSREIVWSSAIEFIKKFPVLGSGTEYMMVMARNGDLTSSAHNVFLGLWKTVGLFPMIIFALYLNKGKNIETISKSNVLSKKMFLSCIVICIVETLLNDSDTYLFFMTLLLTVGEEQEGI